MIKELNTSNLLFKYEPLGIFLNQSLKNNTLHFSSISKFNDPFESMFNIASTSYNEEGKKYFYNNVFPFTCLKNMSHQERLTFIEQQRKPEIMDAFFPMDLKHSLHTFISDLYGVVCFSSKYDEILMWSHYASNEEGKGLCQIFNKDLFETNIDGYPKISNITYKNELPVINVKVSVNQFGFNIEPIILTKRINWHYENEVRAFINMSKITPFIETSRIKLEANNCQLRNVLYKPNALEGIIFNHKCTKVDIKNIVDIIESNTRFNKVKLYQAQVNSWTGLYSYKHLK